jgi:hypothetical protein
MAYVVQYPRLIAKILLVLAAIVACIAPCPAQTKDPAAQEQPAGENVSAADASKEAANPLASVWLLQLQQNNNWIGMSAKDGNRVQSNLQFQPLMSVKLSDDWNLIARPVLQLVNSTPLPQQTGQGTRADGFGDTVLALAASPGPRLVGHWLLAAGPTFIFPTATNSLIGQNKWQIGPAAALGYEGKDFITYVFPQQWFSVGGDGRKTSHMLLYYAFVHVYQNGWSVGTNPAMTVDWEASRGNRVAFPVGLQVGKLRKIGILPVKFEVQAQYYAVHPQIFGPKWNLQLQMTPIVPGLIKHKLF